jgi:general secretion pathway protein I
MGAAAASIRCLFDHRDAEPERSGEQLMPKLAINSLPAPSGGMAGFTLLEVLIAFIIATLAIAEVMQAVGTSLESSRAAAHYQEAVSRARSHLDFAIYDTALVPADTQGDDGQGFHWHLRVTPAASTTRQLPGLARRGAAAVVLYAVSVTISWRDGHSAREVRLESAQLAEIRS